MTAKKTKVHRAGNRCGYNVLPNKSIEIAPLYKDEMEAIWIEQRAIDSMISAVMQSIAPLNRGLEKRRRDWWTKVFEDYELDGNFTYDIPSGTLSRKEADDGLAAENR
ncbi:MAG: hypothetical protein WC343_04250 [Bacilli bacterium]|jgi:hypothetical protein